MSVSNVYNQGKINAIKLNLGTQAKKASANKPAYMQMTGSIFDAPGVKNSASSTANSLNDLNTSRSLSELNASGETSGSSKSSTDDIKSIDNAADGKAAAASAESSADEVESLTKDTQNDQKTVEKYDSDAQKLNKQIEKDDKNFKAQLKKQENDLKKDNEKLQKLVQETEETQTEVENAQNELDSLLGSASFSINKDPNSGEATNPNQDRINELQTIIGSKVTLLQSNGQQIYSLQRSSSKTITKMNKTNANYVKVNQQNSKAITENQSKTDKVIETATTIEQISALVSQTGQAVNYAGQGLIALGSAMSWAAGAGAALIATGQVMQKVGTVVEMVGNYGQTAANITKTAAYAADGNLAGALTSAASAVQTGSAAVKSTKNLGNTFEKINEQANQATQKLAANTAARETVKDMSAEELGGMSKKQARKSVASQLQAQMADPNSGITTNAKWAKGQLNDLTEQLTSAPKDGTSIAQQALNNSKTQFADAVTSAGGTIKDGVVGGLDRKAKSAINEQVKTGFRNTSTDTVKSSKKFDWSKLANGLQATAAKLGSQNTQQTAQNTTSKAAPAQWDLSKDRIFQKTYNYNRRYA